MGTVTMVIPCIYPYRSDTQTSDPGKDVNKCSQWNVAITPYDGQDRSYRILPPFGI